MVLFGKITPYYIMEKGPPVAHKFRQSLTYFTYSNNRKTLACLLQWFASIYRSKILIIMEVIFVLDCECMPRQRVRFCTFSFLYCNRIQEMFGAAFYLYKLSEISHF